MSKAKKPTKAKKAPKRIDDKDLGEVVGGSVKRPTGTTYTFTKSTG